MATLTDKAIMREVAQRALEMIEENVRRGVGYDGKPFQYSTRPFARPLGRLKGAAGFVKDGRLKRFTTKEGKLWAVVMGGYKDWRSMTGLNPTGDYLQASGRMMRNLNVIEVTDTSARLGFPSPVQARKALWLSVTGASKSRRLWLFMGLSQAQQQELADYAASLMTGKKITDLLNF